MLHSDLHWDRSLDSRKGLRKVLLMDPLWADALEQLSVQHLGLRSDPRMGLPTDALTDLHLD